MHFYPHMSCPSLIIGNVISEVLLTSSSFISTAVSERQSATTMKYYSFTCVLIINKNHIGDRQTAIIKFN